MSVVLRIIQRANGYPDRNCDGRYIRKCSPNGHFGNGLLIVTDDIKRARLFTDALEALEAWRAVSATHPLRPDGKPNRPLTAFTVEIVSPEVITHDQPAQ